MAKLAENTVRHGPSWSERWALRTVGAILPGLTVTVPRTRPWPCWLLPLELKGVSLKTE